MNAEEILNKHLAQLEARDSRPRTAGEGCAMATGSPLRSLVDRWQQCVDDTNRTINNPEACARAGVLEINRLRTVNRVRWEMLNELRAILTTSEYTRADLEEVRRRQDARWAEANHE